MITIEESNAATRKHIVRVQQLITDTMVNLLARAGTHDASKLQEPEASGYAALSARLEDIIYGSEEYKQALMEAKHVIDHHYAHNTHHPEHWQKGIDDMSLLDILEMLCDWKAAGERTKHGGSIEHSITYNSTHFQISPQLTAILFNTARELKWM